MTRLVDDKFYSSVRMHLHDMISSPAQCTCSEIAKKPTPFCSDLSWSGKKGEETKQWYLTQPRYKKEDYWLVTEWVNGQNITHANHYNKFIDSYFETKWRNTNLIKINQDTFNISSRLRTKTLRQIYYEWYLSTRTIFFPSLNLKIIKQSWVYKK